MYGNLVDPLVAREALAAAETFAPPANDFALAALARVDDLIAQMRAIRTFHRQYRNKSSGDQEFSVIFKKISPDLLISCSSFSLSGACARLRIPPNRDRPESRTANPSTIVGSSDTACSTSAAPTARSFGHAIKRCQPNLHRRLESADAAGRRHRHADDQQRDDEKRSGKRHVDAERPGHRPDARSRSTATAGNDNRQRQRKPSVACGRPQAPRKTSAARPQACA